MPDNNAPLLDPSQETSVTSSDTKAEPAAAAESVSREDFEKLVAHTNSLTTALKSAGSRLAVFDRVAAALIGKPEETLTKEEQAVVGELKRLMPHILPNAKLLDEMPNVRKAVDQAAQATAEALVTAAFTYQLDLQREAGYKVDDPRTNRVVAGAIRDWINEDKIRQDRFWRGDRGVVREAFDDVKTVLAGSSPQSKVRAEVTPILKHRPQNSAPARGGTPGSGETGLNFQDPKAVRAAMKAALA